MGGCFSASLKALDTRKCQKVQLSQSGKHMPTSEMQRSALTVKRKYPLQNKNFHKREKAYQYIRTD